MQRAVNLATVREKEGELYFSEKSIVSLRYIKYRSKKIAINLLN